MTGIYEDIEFWIKVLTFAGVVGSFVYTFFSNRRKNSDDKVKALDVKMEKKHASIDDRLHTGSKRMDEHEKQIQRLNLTVDDLPTKDDIHAIQLAMGELAGNQKEMKALLQGHREFMTRVNTVLTRQEDHLLRAGNN